MACAILRVEKKHSFAQLQIVSDHNNRIHTTNNVDPSRKHLNRVLIGSHDIVSDVKQFYEAKQVGPFRKNGVLAVEIVLAFSPGWIKNESGEYLPGANLKVKDWVNRCLAWARERFGDNLLNCIYHGDELSPHLHLVLGVSYWDSKRNKWRLSADRFFGSKAKLSELQTSHANAVKTLGLSRGVEGSKANHQTLKAFYRELSKAEKFSQSEDLPKPGKSPVAFMQWQQQITQLSQASHAEHEEREELYLAEIAYWKTRYMNSVGSPAPSSAKPSLR